MKKLITVEMLTTKGAMDVPGAFCEVCQSNQSIREELKEDDIFAKDYLSPLDPENNEDDFGIIVGIGYVVMAILKKMCTPEAWEMIINEFKEKPDIVGG